MEYVREKFELSEKAQQLIARLRTIDTSADPLAKGFDYAAHMAPLEAVLAELFRALLVGKVSKRDADAVSTEARRIQHDFRAHIRRESPHLGVSGSR